jgi:microcystin-dependent protein
MEEVIIGSLALFPYTFTPKGWELCNGKLLNVSQYQGLYTLIGTKFGGDGIKEFAIPDLTGTEPKPGLNYYIAVQGIFPSRL